MSAVIRRLLSEDVDACIELRREALEREPFAFLASPTDDRGLSVTIVRDGLANASQATFGAFTPELVGIVGVGRDSRVKTAHKANIWGLYVTQAHQRTGLGRALMTAALQFARTLPGVTQVHLSVGQNATVAARLYASLGFVTWGTEPNALRIGGESIAEHHMVLELEPQQ